MNDKIIIQREHFALCDFFRSDEWEQVEELSENRVRAYSKTQRQYFEISFKLLSK